MTSPSFLANALHLRIQPALRSLNQRRQLLAKLQEQYGDVLVYKSLCYDKNLPRESAQAALLIFRGAESSAALRAAGEVRLALDDAAFDPYALHWTLHPDAPGRASTSREAQFKGGDPARLLPKQAPAAPSPHGALSAALLSAAAAENGAGGDGLADPTPLHLLPPSLQVTVRATRWRGNHERYLEHTPFWGKFRIDASLMQAHLASRVPMPGLSDVGVQRPSKPEFLVRDRKAESERGASLMELWEAGRRGARKR